MSGHKNLSNREARMTIEDLREQLRLFSFHDDVLIAGSAIQNGLSPEIDIRSGSIGEWLAATRGAGAVTCAVQVMSRFLGDRGVWVVVDPLRECYVPAFSGWGINPSRIVVLRPATLQEMCWA